MSGCSQIHVWSDTQNQQHVRGGPLGHVAKTYPNVNIVCFVLFWMLSSCSFLNFFSNNIHPWSCANSRNPLNIPRTTQKLALIHHDCPVVTVVAHFQDLRCKIWAVKWPILRAELVAEGLEFHQKKTINSSIFWWQEVKRRKRIYLSAISWQSLSKITDHWTEDWCENPGMWPMSSISGSADAMLTNILSFSLNVAALSLSYTGFFYISVIWYSNQATYTLAKNSVPKDRSYHFWRDGRKSFQTCFVVLQCFSV